MNPRALPVAAGLGTALMAVASWSVAAVPVAWHPEHHTVGTFAYYVGLALLGGSWLVLGRSLLSDTGVPSSRRLAQRFALVGAAPMLAAAPFGRDLWAYAAQGHLVGTGRDPYQVGPAAAPGRFAHEVSARWLHTPAPYGPLWLRFSQFAAWVAHGHPAIAALVLRVPAYIGLILCCWAVGALADRFGGLAGVALWLGAASPLMTVLGVGGGHNDLLMLGLALAGLALCARPGLGALAAAAALASVGALIKSPAAIAVAFTVPVWLATGREAPTRRRVVAAVATALASAVATVAALTGLTGLGFGWATKVNSDAQWVSWLSLPSAAAMLGKWATGNDHPRSMDDTLRVCRTVGEVVALVALALIWLVAMRRVRDRRAVIGLLTLALTVAAVLGPSVQPWYYLWALTVAGLAAQSGLGLLALATVPVVFTVMITPSGKGWESDWRAPLVVLGGVGVTALVLRRSRAVVRLAQEPVVAPPRPGR